MRPVLATTILPLLPPPTPRHKYKHTYMQWVINLHKIITVGLRADLLSCCYLKLHPLILDLWSFRNNEQGGKATERRKEVIFVGIMQEFDWKYHWKMETKRWYSADWTQKCGKNKFLNGTKWILCTQVIHTSHLTNARQIFWVRHTQGMFSFLSRKKKTRF